MAMFHFMNSFNFKSELEIFDYLTIEKDSGLITYAFFSLKLPVPSAFLLHTINR